MSDNRTLLVERSTSTAHRLFHYDGVCANIHGHNMEWDVRLEVSMDDVGDDNMPLDFKEVSDRIDETDHAILLNEDDPLLEALESAEVSPDQVLGDYITFEGDPTCELISQWMADKLREEIDAVESSYVKIAETEKYSMSADSHDYE